MNDCICLKADKSKSGYARITVNNKTHLAHRYFYEQEFGEIPQGFTIHHECRNRACINLEHLKLLSNSEHKKLHIKEDGLSGISQINANKVVCKRGHKFNKDNQGKRFCKICKAARQRRYKETHREQINAYRRHWRNKNNSF